MDILVNPLKEHLFRKDSAQYNRQTRKHSKNKKKKNTWVAKRKNLKSNKSDKRNTKILEKH